MQSRTCARRAVVLMIAVAACAAGGGALSQTLSPAVSPPVQNDAAPPVPPRDQVPQAKEPGAASGTLSEQLSRSGGVIHPPPQLDPKIAAPTPDPGARSMKVIPPPGTPGGDPTVKPK